jgi:hypothetical protein
MRSEEGVIAVRVLAAVTVGDGGLHLDHSRDRQDRWSS